VQNTDATMTTEIQAPTEPADAPKPLWHAAVDQLLSEAAALCAQHGVDLDVFMSGAWSAYMAARPGLRAQLEEAQIREQIDELRRRGRVGTA
jgi:hypothetical protein